MNNILMNEGYDSKKTIFVKAEGNYIYDDKNQKYLDTTIGSGTHILGHRNTIIVETLKKQLDTSMLFTTNNNIAFEVSELITQCVPSIDKIVFKPELLAELKQNLSLTARKELAEVVYQLVEERKTNEELTLALNNAVTFITDKLAPEVLERRLEKMVDERLKEKLGLK